jgi:hypothetical protein
MNYGALIKDAFRITIHNRYLWFFGFFVGLGSGGGGGGGGGDVDEQRSAEIASISAVQQAAFDNALLIVGLVVVGLLILLVVCALYVVSQGGLTESVAAGILVALLVAGAFATDSTALRAAAVIVAVLVVIALLIVVFVLLAIVRQFARRELVVRGEGVIGSVGSGYRLLLRMIALVIVGLLLFLPTILLAVAEYTTAAIATGVVAGLILFPLLILAIAVLGTFNHSYWTLAYLQLTNQGGTTRP